MSQEQQIIRSWKVFFGEFCLGMIHETKDNCMVQPINHNQLNPHLGMENPTETVTMRQSNFLTAFEFYRFSLPIGRSSDLKLIEIDPITGQPKEKRNASNARETD